MLGARGIERHAGIDEPAQLRGRRTGFRRLASTLIESAEQAAVLRIRDREPAMQDAEAPLILERARAAVDAAADRDELLAVLPSALVGE